MDKLSLDPRVEGLIISRFWWEILDRYQLTIINQFNAIEFEKLGNISGLSRVVRRKDNPRW